MNPKTFSLLPQKCLHVFSVSITKNAAIKLDIGVGTNRITMCSQRNGNFARNRIQFGKVSSVKREQRNGKQNRFMLWFNQQGVYRQTVRA